MKISRELFEVFKRENFNYRKEDDNAGKIKLEYQEALSEWKSIVNAVLNELNDKDFVVHGTESWQNSGKLTKTFWSRIKHKDRLDSSSCMALMINKGILMAYLEWHNYKSEESTNNLNEHNKWIGYLEDWVNTIGKEFNHYRIWLQHDEEINENYIDLEQFLSNEELRKNLIYECKSDSKKWLRIGEVFKRDEVLAWEDVEKRIAKTVTEVKNLYINTANTRVEVTGANLKSSKGVELDEKRIWAFAPGKEGYKWDEFREQGIMAIDWEIGDLREYKSKKGIAAALIELDESEHSSRTNDSLALWQFCNEIQVGDKIFAKAGSKKLLGVGEVASDYIYDDKREEFQHIRKVNWIKAGSWTVEEKFAIKTLTDITDYEEFR